MLDFINKIEDNFTTPGQYILSEYINTWSINKLICTPEMHDEKSFNDWKILARKIYEYSDTVDDIEYQYLCKKGRQLLETANKDKNGIPYIKCSEIRIYDSKLNSKSYNDPDYLFTSNAELISGVLEMIYEVFSDDLVLRRFDSVMIAQKMVHFTYLWEKGLGLDLDID